MPNGTFQTSHFVKNGVFDAPYPRSTAGIPLLELLHRNSVGERILNVSLFFQFFT